MTDVPSAPRAVTPVGIVAELLGSVLDRLPVPSGANPDRPFDDGVRADLVRAHALAAGLEEYVTASVAPESPALAALAERTASEDWAARASDGGVFLEQEMLSGHAEGALLAFLVRLTGARRVLEIGMFTGYSALAMAEALPDDGTVVACELDPYVAQVAMESFAASPAGSRIEVLVGPALDTLRKLRDVGQRFDLVFVDADKPGYADYLDALLEDFGLLEPGALVCVDNTMLQGEPWLPEGARSVNGTAVAAFNAKVAADPRVEQVLIPLRDGVTLIRRVS